jgi:hypothetical protein
MIYFGAISYTTVNLTGYIASLIFRGEIMEVLNDGKNPKTQNNYFLSNRFFVIDLTQFNSNILI